MPRKGRDHQLIIRMVVSEEGSLHCFVKMRLMRYVFAPTAQIARVSDSVGNQS